MGEAALGMVIPPTPGGGVLFPVWLVEEVAEQALISNPRAQISMSLFRTKVVSSSRLPVSGRRDRALPRSSLDILHNVVVGGQMMPARSVERGVRQMAHAVRLL